MRIAMENFNYKGHHVDQVIFELPNLYEVDDVFEERIGEYLLDVLDNLIDFQEEEL